MKITEIRIKLTGNQRSKLRGFCSVTFNDAFVIRDLKIIDGNKGPFLAMPSRKLADRCARCGNKNHLRACYCNQCGQRLDPERAPRDGRGRARLHADLAHPINSECRIELHRAVISAFHEELEKSKQEGYKPTRFDDFDDHDDFFEDEDYVHELQRRQVAREQSRESRSAAGGDSGSLQQGM